jgi:signal transduction histidine kinase
VLFAAIAVAAAASGGFELLLSHARTVEVSATLLRWVHLPMSGIILAIPWFVLLMFHAGRRWLAVASNSVWIVALGINAFSPYSRLYERITGLERVSGVGGVEFTWVTGTAHPLRWVGQVAVLLTLAFVVDAAVSLWKRGEKRRAAVVGGCLATSVAVGLFHSALVTAGAIRTPYFVSVAFLFIVGGMAYELVSDAVRVEKLEQKVEVQEAEVAHLSRQSMLREMSGGVAHELSQPLTAILNNAEAALSFLDRDSPDLGEVRGALEDIAEQDRHATEVARGLARLLREGECRSERLTLNDLVEEVLELARGDLDRQGIDVIEEYGIEMPGRCFSGELCAPEASMTGCSTFSGYSETSFILLDTRRSASSISVANSKDNVISP